MRLRAVLIRMGAVKMSSTWGVGGSQEVETLVVNLDGREVVVEGETYVGLSVTGDKDLVNAIADRVAERLASSGNSR